MTRLRILVSGLLQGNAKADTVVSVEESAKL